MSQVTTKPDPLVWGQGGPVFEVFLEPTCPFSAIVFGKLPSLQKEFGENGLVLMIWLQSQPWHMFSGIICRAILAASCNTDGKASAWAVMEAIYSQPENFEFEHHCSGPNMDVTPNALIKRIESASGVPLKEQFARHDLDREIKRHAKYARQNGIHASPTFMVNGIVDPGLGSRDPIGNWVDALRQA